MQTTRAWNGSVTRDGGLRRATVVMRCYVAVRLPRTMPWTRIRMYAASHFKY